MSVSSVGNSPASLAFYKSASRNASPELQEQSADAASSQSTKDIFLKYAKMNPIERMRENYLKSQGLTEESLASLPEEERKKIEKEIQELIKRKLGVDSSHATGQIIDLKA